MLTTLLATVQVKFVNNKIIILSITSYFCYFLGKYLFVNMADSRPKGAGFASSAAINSIIFNPPPRVHGNSSSRFYNSCTVSKVKIFLLNINKVLF